MKKITLVTMTLAGILATIIAGCDIGINPLIFDGSVTGKTFYVNTTGTSFDEGASFDLSSLKDLTDQTIDSLKFYNLTILIDSATGTPSISGSIVVDSVNGVPASDTIVTLTNVPITDFSSERSIFDPTLAGVTYNASAVAILKGYFNSGAVIHVRASGSSSSSPLVFDIHVKIYGQVFTKPK